MLREVWVRTGPSGEVRERETPPQSHTRARAHIHTALPPLGSARLSSVCLRAAAAAAASSPPPTPPLAAALPLLLLLLSPPPPTGPDHPAPGRKENERSLLPKERSSGRKRAKTAENSVINRFGVWPGGRWTLLQVRPNLLRPPLPP